MNIRGLILDDLKHTVHLQILEFLRHPNPGSETEEEAWPHVYGMSIWWLIRPGEIILLGNLKCWW
jgi:hypothetical protein